MSETTPEKEGETVSPPATMPESEQDSAARKSGTGTAGPPETRTWRAPKKPLRINFLWIVLPAVLLLILLAVFVGRPKPMAKAPLPATASQAGDAEPELSNYTAFVERNRALIEKYSEQVLTDEPYAGEAPLAVRESGPLISSEADPQVAALADALRIRVQAMLGSQTLSRGNMVTRTVKGDFRGFKVQAVEKLEGGKAVAEEVTVITPQGGVIKTSDRVLSSLQKTDFERMLAEVQAAGMEFSPLRSIGGGRSFRGQLRVLRYWGKPIPADRLIAGRRVGRVSLAMPIDELQGRIAATDLIIKRRVLINDVYHDVYKVSDQLGNPLFFVYEKGKKVLGIWVVSDSFKTGRGIGINQSLDQILIHYPAVTLSRSEKRTPFIRLEDVDGMVIIQNDGDKRVVAILIGDSPEFR